MSHSNVQLIPTLQAGELIVSIDPGLTTGICQIRYGGSRVFEILASVEITWDRRFQLNDFIKGMDRVILERFSLYSSHKDTMVNNEFPSVRIIGIVDYMCFLHSLDDRMYFQPAHVMGNVQVLPEHAKWIHAGEHCKDAYKHARYFVLSHRDVSPTTPVSKGH